VTKAYWSCAAVTLLSALVSAGFPIVGLLSSGDRVQLAQYAASRSVALVLSVATANYVRSAPALAALGSLLRHRIFGAKSDATPVVDCHTRGAA
jgi:hypothetical protein